MNLFNKFQQKDIYKLTIINLSIIVIFGFFSFNLLPKLISKDEFNYQNININQDKIDSINILIESILGTRNTERLNKTLIKDPKVFLNNYFNFITLEQPQTIYYPHCPASLLQDNMRGIQIYFNEKKEDVFNVKFHYSQFLFDIKEKTKINKCFNFIFVEHLNKYFVDQYNILLETLEKNLITLQTFYNLKNERPNYNLEKYKKISYTEFLRNIENNLIKNLKFENNGIIIGSLVNDKFFYLYYPQGEIQKIFLNSNIIEKITNNIQVEFSNSSTFISGLSNIADKEKLLNYLKSQKFKNDLYFVNKNQRLNLGTDTTPSTFSLQFIAFMILVITLLIMQIFCQKYKKKILIFFNKK